MNIDVKKTLETINVEIEKISDPHARNIIALLLQIIESQAETIRNLTEENRALKDEISRLKGEQGKPDIRKQTKKSENHSSEEERKNSDKDKKPRGNRAIKITRTQKCTLDKSTLPDDVIFKGYARVVVQDLKISPDNIEFQKEIYYSPSLGQTFTAPNPPGYEGEYGPTIKALILDMANGMKATESAIHHFLSTQGVDISSATISRLLTQNVEPFQQEKEEIFKAGLASSVFQQTDDTSARVKGQNVFTHIFCNLFYTAFFTRRQKTRLTVLEILSQGELMFCFNESTYELMRELDLSEKRMLEIQEKNPQVMMSREGMDSFLLALFPNKNTHQKMQHIIMEASAIVAYQQRPDAVKILLADDAAQFKKITELLALCWVHDGRHYKKLMPVVPAHQKALKEFLNQYWAFYRKLLAYKSAPTEAMKSILTAEFETLFSTKTQYLDLDERIAKTKSKQASLLLVLDYQEVPLHNNDSELGARQKARVRDISYHTMSQAGTEAKDIFMTLVATAKKLGVNTYHYFLDRITQKYEMQSLAELITTMGQRHTTDSS